MKKKSKRPAKKKSKPAAIKPTLGFIGAGNMAEAKRRGTVRMEGKTYPVKDGDILNILFNV